jgi:hypothetical protein
MTPRSQASYISKAIVAVMGISVVVFSMAFVKSLYGVYGQISTAANLFGSANVMMYLTIEGLFLMCVIAGAFFVIRK